MARFGKEIFAILDHSCATESSLKREPILRPFGPFRSFSEKCEMVFLAVVQLTA